MATKKRATKGSGGGRGSPEAVAKRRTARQLNSLLTGGAKSGPRRDGRTEKRRKRLIEELKKGRKGAPLKPITVLSHVEELLAIGETLASLRKQGVKPRKSEDTPAVLEIARRAQAAYGFRPETWRMLGVDLGAPRTAGRKPRKTGRGK